MRGGQRSILLLLVIVGVSVLLSLLRDTGAGISIEGFLHSVVSPIRSTVTSAASRSSQTINDVRHIDEVQKENRLLRSEVSELRALAARQKSAERENTYLREALAYKRENPDVSLLTARVVGMDSVDALDTVVIDRGADNGVRVGMAIISRGNLAGRVLAVTSSSASILPIDSTQSSVHAVTTGGPGETDGIITSDGGEHLTLTRIDPEAVLTVGDVVMTSGLAGRFPRGLPIGRVLSIHSSPASVFRKAVIDRFERTEDLDILQVVLSKAARPA
jgi:rod shape-determining protein MreC